MTSLVAQSPRFPVPAIVHRSLWLSPWAARFPEWGTSTGGLLTAKNPRRSNRMDSIPEKPKQRFCRNR
jgi:hypothetical protein